MKYYTVKELSEKFGVSEQTIYSRFRSPYAKTRWGVVTIPRIDGSVKKGVPEDSLVKWFVETNSYVGRPTNEQL